MGHRVSCRLSRASCRCSRQVWEQEHLSLWLRPLKILVTSNTVSWRCLLYCYVVTLVMVLGVEIVVVFVVLLLIVLTCRADCWRLSVPRCPCIRHVRTRRVSCPLSISLSIYLYISISLSVCSFYLSIMDPKKKNSSHDSQEQVCLITSFKSLATSPLKASSLPR